MSFFPLHRKQVEECKTFQELTAHEKIVYWYLQSQFNLNGEGWYEPDLKIAITTGMSKSKMQKSRYKFKKRGWIDYRPGFRADVKNVATSYNRVKWAAPPERGSGDSFIQMHRWAFEAMLAHVRTGTLTHNDVVTYVILCYWYKCHEKAAADNGGWWFITKESLRNLTGFHNIERSIRNLHEKFTFTSGDHLFEYDDEWHRYTFTELARFTDPSDDEDTRKFQECRREEVEKGYRQLSEIERRKREVHPEVAADELPDYWKKASGRVSMSTRQKGLLRQWAKQHGVRNVCREIDRYLLLINGTSFPKFETYWNKHHPEGSSWQQKL